MFGRTAAHSIHLADVEKPRNPVELEAIETVSPTPSF
jgi:predicted transcriptional regulator